MRAVLVALILFPVLAGAAPVGNAARRNPTASASSTLKIAGVDYIEARIFFARFNIKGAWLTPDRTLVFQSTAAKVTIEADKREVTFNGLRVFLGEPVIARYRTLYLSRIDAERFLTPILAPARATGPAVPALKVIAIDPGHGGQDAGTQNTALKLNEKTFTLDVARRLQKLLAAQGYKIVMIRKDDTFIPLPQRAEIANKAGADLFISIHFNSVSPNTVVKGSETYVMTPQFQRSTAGDKRDPSDNMANPGNRMDPWNAQLGYQIHRQLIAKLGTTDRGLKRARFAVLRLVNCPGVLVEAGYLSNLAEARKIASADYRDDIAEAIAAGVMAYAKTTGAGK